MTRETRQSPTDPGTAVFKAFIGLDGRIRRSTYWGCTALLVAISKALVAFGLLIFGSARLARDPQSLAMLQLAVAILIFYPWLAYTMKRLHDLSMSGWWSLVFIVPHFMVLVATAAGFMSEASFVAHLVLRITGILSLAMFIAVGFIKGTDEENEYGPSLNAPRQPLAKPPVRQPARPAAQKARPAPRPAVARNTPAPQPANALARSDRRVPPTIRLPAPA